MDGVIKILKIRFGMELLIDFDIFKITKWNCIAKKSGTWLPIVNISDCSKNPFEVLHCSNLSFEILRLLEVT